MYKGTFTELSRLLYPYRTQAIRTCTSYLLVYIRLGFSLFFSLFCLYFLRKGVI